ncbi:hypothetical protein [Ensifer sp. B1-9]|uniref:hypothetical protein n=1 Tax=Ensifer sp. B1-9 TaxID=3141455 RepID=UPI003D1F5110
MSSEIVRGALAAAKAKATFRIYSPTCTVKCDGLPMFRSQTARDLACLLDINPSVVTWICMPQAIVVGDQPFVADFLAQNEDGERWLFDAPDRRSDERYGGIAEAARENSLRYRKVLPDELYDGHRLRNAKDLLRYGNHQPALGDRIRLLAALDEQGSLTVSDALNTIRESNPVASLASMILHGFLEVDLDSAPIGPETVVRRIRR